MVALGAPGEAGGAPALFSRGPSRGTPGGVGPAVADGLFEDPSWVARWDVDFAGFYLDALEAYRRDPATAPAPWREAFVAKATLPPQGHVLLGVNAHINFDLPQSLVRVISDEDFAAPSVLATRERDHERIDGVLSSRVTTEDVELQNAGDKRTWMDRLMAPLNHAASRQFLREARRKAWANTAVLHSARMVGDGENQPRPAEPGAPSAPPVVAPP